MEIGKAEGMSVIYLNEPVLLGMGSTLHTHSNSWFVRTACVPGEKNVFYFFFFFFKSLLFLYVKGQFNITDIG